ncbi:hypothetical protein JHN53_35080 [Streptomyces sp. MBT58]|uniref:hypothetical protein n=1 Tax=Streptomyces sp. MBT58 TaxID=1488389 RepID=UPI0019132CA5|nr:hypothetical protein [Streptomyces sp. MBT58]MBK5996748.1 hypothetical protein [Streptomyces sp. MBT58]
MNAASWRTTSLHWLRLRRGTVNPCGSGSKSPRKENYAGVEESGPIWMTNVMAAVGDRGTTLSITLDGMPDSQGEYGNWNTPETIVDQEVEVGVLEISFPAAGVDVTCAGFLW